MSRKIVPRSMWSFPSLRFPFSIFEEEEEGEGGWLQQLSDASGLSVSEDDTHVYVEAALPGIKPNEIEITFDQGILWVKAEKKEEAQDKNKKYYRKAVSNFSYRVAIPGYIDESKQPDATCKNGVLKITFTKTKKVEAKKIPVKGE